MVEINYIYKSKFLLRRNNFLVILVGDISVGKTCLLTRYVKDTVNKMTTPTIGVEFATTNVVMRDGATVKAQLWDTAG